jgi:hypothetical protein
LSLELATRWDWRNGAGQLKDMAARTLLGKLDQRGLIQLPARRQIPTNRMGCSSLELELAQGELVPIACALPELGTLQVREVSAQAAERAWVKRALGQFHYLGFRGTVGENLQYVVGDSQGRRLACLVLERRLGNVRTETDLSVGRPSNGKGIWRASPTTPDF